jgi:hypothetical protein
MADIQTSPRVVVVILGGWSPGPLPYLSRFMMTAMTSSSSSMDDDVDSNRRHLQPSPTLVTSTPPTVVLPRYEIVDVTQCLPMPPIPSMVWCCCTTNPRMLMMWVVLLILIYLLVALPLSLLPSSWSPVSVMSLCVCVGLVTIVWFRFLVAVIVRTSIDKGIDIAMSAVSTTTAQERENKSNPHHTNIHDYDSMSPPPAQHEDVKKRSNRCSDLYHSDHISPQGVEKGERGGEKQKEEEPITVLIGFSWGGAVR